MPTLRGEHLQHGREVGRVPVAGHVGLAEADQPAVAEPGGEGLRPVDRHDRGAPGLPVPDPSTVPVRVADFQRQPADGGLEDGVRGAAGDGGLQARGHRGDAGPGRGVDVAGGCGTV